MMQTKLTHFSSFSNGKASNYRKFTKLKFEDMKCKYDRPYWIWTRLLFWQPETSGEVMEVDKQLKFKSHERMQVEFISNNVDVITHDCLSSAALALESRIRQACNIGPEGSLRHSCRALSTVQINCTPCGNCQHHCLFRIINTIVTPDYLYGQVLSILLVIVSLEKCRFTSPSVFIIFRTEFKMCTCSTLSERL